MVIVPKNPDVGAAGFVVEAAEDPVVKGLVAAGAVVLSPLFDARCVAVVPPAVVFAVPDAVVNGIGGSSMGPCCVAACICDSVGATEDAAAVSDVSAALF